MASTSQLKISDLFSVKGYVCVVTGGGTGIGLMCTQALAANGAKVYITGRRMEVLENAAKSHSPGDGDEDGGEIIPIGPYDVTSKEDLEKLVNEISQKEKHINLLINNAGIRGPKGEPSSESASELHSSLWSAESPSDWAEVFNTNVTAVYFSTVAFLPLLQAAYTSSPSSSSSSSSPKPAYPRRSSSVIVISSMSGIMRSSQNHFSYNASKGATVHLSKMMSAEFEKADIRVNSIAPGYFPSELSTDESSDEHNKSELPAEVIRSKIPLPAQRAGQDQEMAQMVLLFARNLYVNGQVVAVDGGVLNQVPSA